MQTSTTTSLRVRNDILKTLQEKYPEINRSVLINNTLDYILSQDENFINEFATKKP